VNPHTHSDACLIPSQELAKPFLDKMEQIIVQQRKVKVQVSGEEDGKGCLFEMAEGVGPYVWAVLHGAAEAFKEHG